MSSLNVSPTPSEREPINKASEWHRLAAEGRLDAFNARREDIRRELRDSGVKRKLASDAAWRGALEEYPPLANEAVSQPESDIPE